MPAHYSPVQYQCWFGHIVYILADIKLAEAVAAWVESLWGRHVEVNQSMRLLRY